MKASGKTRRRETSGHALRAARAATRQREARTYLRRERRHHGGAR